MSSLPWKESTKVARVATTVRSAVSAACRAAAVGASRAQRTRTGNAVSRRRCSNASSAEYPTTTPRGRLQARMAPTFIVVCVRVVDDVSFLFLFSLPFGLFVRVRGDRV
ncbi:hypothetical protein [Pandoravirus japonicus]|uniref:Uncharacterized protein n=1 Tax=Pandoravirus japonicus TaxID=2823154 RepID=A0A811BQH2_9VIRU|nr:hypothetical protein [Pandoravirus japonicus]